MTIARRKYANAGYTREEWRRIRSTLASRQMGEAPPRPTSEILADLAFQLETLWNRFPREFVK